MGRTAVAAIYAALATIDALDKTGVLGPTEISCAIGYMDYGLSELNRTFPEVQQ